MRRMNLRSHLDKQKTSPAAFAEAIGVSVTALYRYIDGSRLPRRDVMARIAAATGGAVQPNDFFNSSIDAAPAGQGSSASTREGS
jgi:transcriptional regulator with XRE-family HTH domain